MGLLVWVMVSCTSPDKGGTLPLPLQTEPANQEAIPASSLVSASPAACQFSGDALSGWAASLPFVEVGLFPQNYQEHSTLNLWFVNAALTQANPDEISTWAAESAISALKQLTSQDNCVMEFDTVFITVMDPQYQVWFTGNLQPADVAQITLGEGNDHSSEVGGGQIIPTDANAPAGGGQACRWVDRYQSLSEQFSTPYQYSSFMLNRDAGGTTLFAYLVLPHRPTDEYIAQLVATIYDLTGCFQAQLDGISITLTLPNSQLILTGYQPLGTGDGYDPATLTYNRFESP